MLDYYGSISMDKDDIIQQLSNKLELSKEWVQKKLDILQLLDKEYSVSGWNIFHKQTIYKQLVDLRDKEYKLSKKKVLLYHGLKEHLCEDILYKIQSMIKD